MIRSLFVAIVMAVALHVAVPSAEQPKPAPTPVSVTGGTPGVSIEFYLNAGKLADQTVNSTGGANWLLDLSNMGKTKVTMYVDVCKDGKIVKVMFVTGSGQAPPEDDGCNRRLAAVSFQSDCAGLHINLDFSNFAASKVIGCGISFTDPKVYGPIGGAAVLLPILLSGGNGSTAISTPNVPSPPSVTLPPAPPTNSTVTNPPPVTSPQPPTVTQVTPRFFIVLVNHPAGASTSRICGIVQIDPPVSGVTWSLAGSGPGVLPNQNISGTFNSNGQAAFVLGISQFGQYTLTLTTNNQGQVQTATSNVSVNSSSFNCPTVPA
jgi:hypothetical protein